MANEIFFDIIKVWWGELAYTYDFLINAKKNDPDYPKNQLTLVNLGKNKIPKEIPLANEIFFDIIKVRLGQLAYTHDFLINA